MNDRPRRNWISPTEARQRYEAGLVVVEQKRRRGRDDEPSQEPEPKEQDR